MISIFLGAYVNFANAQNINCDHIARYLDKEKFEVHIMYTTMCPINKAEYKKLGIHLHKLIHHRFLWYWSKYLTMIFGKYDIYYLPKIEPMDYQISRRHWTSNSVFVSSVEGVISETVNNTSAYRSFFTNNMDSVFAISNCISESIKRYWNYNAPVLPLGVDPINISFSDKETVKNIIWVGNIKANKRPQYLINCAKVFPQLHFTMVGDGEMENSIVEAIEADSLQNVCLTGRIPNDEVYEKMKTCDLLLMTSENEGLPKVTQEAAQCGLPSIYIGENYDIDFIKNGENGFKVMSLDEMKEKIQWLIDNPKKYSEMSKKAAESVQEYLWPVLIKKYENYFERIYKEKAERLNYE